MTRAPTLPSDASVDDRKAVRILVVDDDESLRTVLSIRLEASGFAPITARNAAEALGLIAAVRPALAIVDLRLAPGLGPEPGPDVELATEGATPPGADGLDLFRQLRKIEPRMPVIILTAHGSIPDAVTATREGVAAFLTKPFDGRQLVDEVRRLLAIAAPAATAMGWRRSIVTRNRAMLAIVDEIAHAGPLDATVLVTGASGSGKEVVARAIHEAGRRQRGPFVAINCAALPEALLESELFGHARGAFSGAVAEYPGLFRAGAGGTVFLDEIGDMPLPLQAKLLRVLQERRVRPVGAAREIDVDVRVIAATHRDLAATIRDGTFREDLFYRLNVVRLKLPTLEERRDDISLLADHAARNAAARYGRDVRGFAPDAIELLVGARWPGNVRQLFNVVEQCVVLSEAPIISRTMIERALSGADDQTGAALPSLANASEQFERDYLSQVLKITNGNIAQAARIARRNRTEFYRLLQRHGLRGELFR